jgi:hypothetical protein
MNWRPMDPLWPYGPSMALWTLYGPMDSIARYLPRTLYYLSRTLHYRTRTLCVPSLLMIV